MSSLIDIVVPLEQEGTVATVKSWLKQPGDKIHLNDPLVEIETDKVAVEISAPSDGVLVEAILQPGTEVVPGTILGRMSSSTVSVDVRSTKSTEMKSDIAKRDPGDTLPPGIRRLLAEHNLSASEVPLQGERLTREDILAEANRRKPAVSGVTIIPHDTMRRRIAENLANSVRTAPHVTATFEADFSNIIAHRTAHKTEFERQRANLTFTAYFVAAAAAAMKAAPAVNARWFDDRLEVYDDVNIGIGTALGEKGLIVPVIHKAQSLSLLEISHRLTDVTSRARDGKLTPADVQGGTFSISNHGVSGSLLASPIIIHQPQSAILGIGKLEKRAIVRENDKIEARPMAYVTLTIDHRVIDAYQTNAWLTRFVEVLQAWQGC